MNFHLRDGFGVEFTAKKPLRSLALQFRENCFTVSSFRTT